MQPPFEIYLLRSYVPFGGRADKNNARVRSPASLAVFAERFSLSPLVKFQPRLNLIQHPGALHFISSNEILTAGENHSYPMNIENQDGKYKKCTVINLSTGHEQQAFPVPTLGNAVPWQTADKNRYLFVLVDNMCTIGIGSAVRDKQNNELVFSDRVDWISQKYKSSLLEGVELTVAVKIIIWSNFIIYVSNGKQFKYFDLSSIDLDKPIEEQEIIIQTLIPDTQAIELTCSNNCIFLLTKSELLSIPQRRGAKTINTVIKASAKLPLPEKYDAIFYMIASSNKFTYVASKEQVLAYSARSLQLHCRHEWLPDTITNGGYEKLVCKMRVVIIRRVELLIVAFYNQVIQVFSVGKGKILGESNGATASSESNYHLCRILNVNEKPKLTTGRWFDILYLPKSRELLVAGELDVFHVAKLNYK